MESEARGHGGTTLATIVLHTAREALDCGVQQLADAAGCARSLIEQIESGETDPTLDTIERIVNASGLEVRIGLGSFVSCGNEVGPDPAEVARLRSVVEADRALRGEIGARAAGPPVGAQPEWDGMSLSPGRQIGAAEGRSDCGGWAAVLMKSAMAATHFEMKLFAQTIHVDVQTLERICSGGYRPTVGELTGLLESVGMGLSVRLEVYDDHDDGLHLSALADPMRHRRIETQAERLFASTELV